MILLRPIDAPGFVLQVLLLALAQLSDVSRLDGHTWNG